MHLGRVEDVAMSLMQVELALAKLITQWLMEKPPTTEYQSSMMDSSNPSTPQMTLDQAFLGA